MGRQVQARLQHTRRTLGKPLVSYVVFPTVEAGGEENEAYFLPMWGMDLR